jgi:hypothetical protein
MTKKKKKILNILNYSLFSFSNYFLWKILFIFKKSSFSTNNIVNIEFVKVLCIHTTPQVLKQWQNIGRSGLMQFKSSMILGPEWTSQVHHDGWMIGGQKNSFPFSSTSYSRLAPTYYMYTNHLHSSTYLVATPIILSTFSLMWVIYFTREVTEVKLDANSICVHLQPSYI